MSEKGQEILRVVKAASGYVVSGLVIILITAWFTGSAYAKTLDGVIDGRIDSRVAEKIDQEVLPILKSMQSDMSFLVESTYSDYIAKLLKQVEKIRKDPDDIKMIDIEDVLQKWKTLPDVRKTDDLIMKYDCVKQWYSKNQ